ncbi:MAG: ABC transporter permease subunit [Pseudomonadota bacterium]
MISVLQLELARALRTPGIWVIAAALQCVFAWYSLHALESYIELAPRLSAASNAPGLSTWLLARYCLPATFAAMLAVPVLTMQRVAGDRQSGALSCLLAAPINGFSIAAGKFAALAVLLAGLTTLSLLNVAVQLSVAPLDLQALVYAHACQYLFLLACTGIGLVCSTWCRSPQVAAFCTAASLMLLWLLSQGGDSLFAAFSLGQHISRAMAGVLHTGDIVYFLAIVGVSLAVTARALDNDRVFGDRA